MAQQISGVFPGSSDYSHDLVLSSKGKRFGFLFPNGPQDLRPIPPQRQPPAYPLNQNSWHGGRGVEVFSPNQYAFYDSKDMWTTTPNKLHPQLLTRYAEGFRDAEMNWPDSGDTFVWKPLYTDVSAGNYRYLDVAFTASASSNRERCFLIIRRKVPAGVSGAPGTLTVEWCPNSSGDPGSASKTVTKVSTDAPDVISYIMEFKPSSVLAVTSGTVYHIKIYGASTDSQNNCWEVLCSTGDAGKASTDNSTWVNSTFSPFYRITDADLSRYIYFFNFDGAEYAVDSKFSGAASALYIHGCRGKATAGTTVLLTDSGAGQYGGTFPTMTGWKIRFVRGVGRGQVRTIASNTATTITPDVEWDVAPTTTTEFVCYHPTARWKEITGHGLGCVTAKPVYANGTIFFPQGDATDIRIMQLNYSNANDHGFDAENTRHNQAYFLAVAIDQVRGPQMWRANIQATSAGSPGGKAVSVGQGDTSPAGVPVPFGTDIAYQTSVLTGDNTFSITGLWTYQNQIYVPKEDTMYTVVNRQPTEIKYGADTSPNFYNGRAACTGMDGLFYIAANHDVMYISGSSAVPLGLPNNLPASRSGYVRDLISVLGWMFAAVNAEDGTSSVMKYSFDTKSWSEQFRAPIANRHIRSIAFETGAQVRPTLLIECQGEVLYQEFPLYGTRPQQDTGVLYTWEGLIEFSTIDLLNMNPKYFSLLESVIKGLAGGSTTAAYGREVMFEYQMDNDIGSSNWTHGGAMTLSPTSKIRIAKGSKHKIRIRLRIINNDPDDPPVIENVTLTLFERYRYTREWMVVLRLEEEEDVTGADMYDWLVQMTNEAEPIYVESTLTQLHKKKMALALEPNINLENINEEGFDATAQIILSEVIE
jgi:hypothetical protein